MQPAAGFGGQPVQQFAVGRDGVQEGDAGVGVDGQRFGGKIGVWIDIAVRRIVGRR